MLNLTYVTNRNIDISLEKYIKNIKNQETKKNMFQKLTKT